MPAALATALPSSLFPAASLRRPRAALPFAGVVRAAPRSLVGFEVASNLRPTKALLVLVVVGGGSGRRRRRRDLTADGEPAGRLRIPPMWRWRWERRRGSVIEGRNCVLACARSEPILECVDRCCLCIKPCSRAEAAEQKEYCAESRTVLRTWWLSDGL